MFMQGDIVRYTGNKPSIKKNENGRGEVLAQMGNENGVYVVEFGDNAYVLPESSLTKYVATAQDSEQAKRAAEVVQKKRKRHNDEE